MKKHLYKIVFSFLLLSFQIHAQSTGDYRSASGGGNWNAVTSWEQFDGIDWVAATAVPTSASGLITITDGSIIDLDLSTTLDQLSVQGTLNISAAYALIITNGAGTDLSIASTGIVANKGSLSFIAGATLATASGGTYIHETTASAASIIGAAGSSGMDASSNFIYRGSSVLNPPYAIGGFTYGNLIFESTSGFWQTTNFFSTSPTIVLGKLMVGSTGAGTVRFTESAQTGALTISGGIDVGSGSTYDVRASTANPVTVNGASSLLGTLNIQCASFINNAIISGTGTLRFGSTGAIATTLSGSGSVLSIGQLRISSANNATLSQPVSSNYVLFFNAGNLIGSNNLTIGNGTSDATFQFGQNGGTSASGTFDVTPIFNLGTGGLSINYMEQPVAKTISTEIPSSRAIKSLQIANSNSVILSGGNLTSNFLTLTTGHLQLDNYTLTIANSIAGGSQASHVITNGTGSLKLAVGASATLFPVGVSAASYDPAALTNTGTSDVFAVLVSEAINSPIEASLAVSRQWTITETAPGGSILSLSLTYDAAAPVGSNYNPNGILTMYQYNGSTWTENAASRTGTTFTTAGFTDLTSFYLGNSAALPVELAYFSGKQVGQDNWLNWYVEAEYRANGYALERRLDGESSFYTIGFVPAKGAGLYEFQDADIRKNAVYRLKMVDLDGQIQYSSLVFLARSQTIDLRIYPNPTADVLYFEMHEIAEDAVILVSDAEGHIVMEKTFSGADQTTVEMDLSRLPSGVYSVGIQENSGTLLFSKRVVKL